ncbi:hypothetical protein O3M35_011322 [Rhynocoris fuscipes]|uniref:Ubiquinone biosynthesis protein n=1 Tax=Rhynocoris fuscipes TaxID=488301 RepID=A0AAW1CVU4_9HEMI
MARNIFSYASMRNIIFSCSSVNGCRHRLYCTGSPPDANKSESSQTPKEQADVNDVLLKKQILDSALKFVQINGWTKTSISLGAEVLGYPGVIHGMFPKGGFELIQHFYLTSNEKLIDFLKERTETTPILQNNDLSRKLVRDAIENRLRMILPYIGRWPEALAIMSQPQNVPTSLANLLTMVDDICYFAGDRSVNMNWYTRRIGLAGLYKATELYMLQDSSEDYINTWGFLSRRIEEVEQLNAYLMQTENASQFAKQFATATFTTARNILGLNWNR